jgi:hypothetical protein
MLNVYLVMKNKELFNKSVSILVEAYRNNTLEHGNCYACAVANLIAGNNDIQFFLREIFDGGLELNWSNSHPMWHFVFLTVFEKQTINEQKYYGNSKRQIDSTGYDLYELARIEKAFELAPKGNDEDDWMFNGLLEVYDVLCDIHEIDEEEVISGELIFVKC